MIRHYILILLVTAIALTSCKKDPSPDPIQSKKHRTVIEYIVADNNIYRFAFEDINEIESAWDDDIDGNMVVYFYPVANGNGDDEPRLLLISNDNDPNVINSRVLKTYTRDQHPNKPAVMTQIIADAMQLAPADSYGLVFWSHGSGWIPYGLGKPLSSALPAAGDPSWAGSKLEGIASDDSSGDRAGSSANGAIGYSFGDGSYTSGVKSIEIDDMAEALPDNILFDFIIFDACHMGCIEIAWELRENTKYLISSVAEILGGGFPYTKIIEPMFASGDADVVKIATEFYDHYDAESGVNRTGIISVVKSDALPALATTVKELCTSYPPVGTYSNLVQQYGRTYTNYHDTFYDLGDFVNKTWDADQVVSFESALAAAVIYKANTPWITQNFYGIKVDNHSGLSCYIPQPNNRQPLSLAAYRDRFGWSTASGMGSLVP